MCWEDAEPIAHALWLEIARCDCDVRLSASGSLCPSCDCLYELALGVEAWAVLWRMQRNREARGVVD